MYLYIFLGVASLALVYQMIFLMTVKKMAKMDCAWQQQMKTNKQRKYDMYA